jgi:predicted RNase H-like nuclease (RuvC/YqgF family)
MPSTLLLVLLLFITAAHAWVTPPSSSSRRSLQLKPLNDVSSWREYVPLVVSGLVITDIVLGRPVANAIMKPLQGVQEELKVVSDEASKRRERVDTEAIGREALDQAYASMELRRYLEENMTPEQRLQEIRNKMDDQMSQVDQKLEDSQRKFDDGDY